MATAGQEIDFGIGFRARFVTTAADSNGEVLRMEFLVEPGGAVVKHVHPMQEEHFEVLEGVATIGVGRESQEYTAGQTVAAPPGSTHFAANHSGAPVRIVSEFRPALETEEVWVAMAALGQAGRLNKKGIPRPGDAAVIARRFGSSATYLPGLPWKAQRAMMAPLAALSRRRGFLSGTATQST